MIFEMAQPLYGEFCQGEYSCLVTKARTFRLPLPPANEVAGRCFQSCLSVCSQERDPMWPWLPMIHWISPYRDTPLLPAMEPHCTGTPSRCGTPLYNLTHSFPIVIPGGKDRRPVQICSLKGPLPTCPDIWWILKDILTDILLYWNAFLLYL